MTQYELAIFIATMAHNGVTRWNGEPYITHPTRVAYRAAFRAWDKFSRDWIERLRVVAILHDVVEDTDVTLEQLEKLFGKAAAKNVSALTKSDDADYQAYIDDLIASKLEMAMRVKLADLEDNLALPIDVDWDGRVGDPPGAQRRAKYEEARAKLLKALGELP